MLTRGTIAGVVALVTFVAWKWRKHKAVQRLRELDEGKRCISCDRTDLDVQNGVASCKHCGHRFALAAFQNIAVSTSEIDNLTRPEER